MVTEINADLILLAIVMSWIFLTTITTKIYSNQIGQPVKNNDSFTFLVTENDDSDWITKTMIVYLSSYRIQIEQQIKYLENIILSIATK